MDWLYAQDTNPGETVGKELLARGYIEVLITYCLTIFHFVINTDNTICSCNKTMKCLHFQIRRKHYNGAKLPLVYLSLPQILVRMNHYLCHLLPSMTLSYNLPMKVICVWYGRQKSLLSQISHGALIRVTLQMTLQAHTVPLWQILHNSLLAPSSCSHLLDKHIRLPDFLLNTSFSSCSNALGWSCYCFTDIPVIII